MSEVAIAVEQLSKRYRINQGARARYGTLRDRLAGVLTAPWRRPIAPGVTDAEQTLWALRDISFEVKRGEVVGIIGRNGAGKSTLLKILSRITQPTEGRIAVRGRVGSLLEVGTGFHPELTGRENIYLNGAILGMKREEIARKFDEIVGFAEVERFIDTPVKFYSSGMYTRLAFAVAAHLESEILVVDEVLAVGDAAFQKKCLGRMGEVANQGRTVLLVSHNIGQIRRLCCNVLWIDRGNCVEHGPADAVIPRYLAQMANAHPSSTKQLSDASPHPSGFISWRASNMRSDYCYDQEGYLDLEICLAVDQPIVRGHHGLVLQTIDGANVCGWGFDDLRFDPGIHTLRYRIQCLPIRPGIYYWYASLWDGSRKIDALSLAPEMVVGGESHTTLSDEWAGQLNVPCEISISH